MSTKIESVRRRKIRVYRISAGLEPLTVTVEMPSGHETKVGVAIGIGPRSSALDSRDVEVRLLGRSRFNPVAFPREGALPQLRVGRSRAAVATFRFEAVGPDSRPAGLEVLLRGRVFQVRFGRGAKPERPKAHAIPPTVAKLLPRTWPKGPAK